MILHLLNWQHLDNTPQFVNSGYLIKVVSKNQDDADGDLITLTGCGQITQWKLPEIITKCPVRGCGKPFGTRKEAIVHYKEKHARNSILCFVCAKPFVFQHPHHFIQHFHTRHPSVALPFSFNIREYGSHMVLVFLRHNNVRQ